MPLLNSPYVSLAVQVAAVLGGVGVLWLIVPRRPLPAVASLAVAVFLAFNLLPRMQGTAQTLRTVRGDIGVTASASPHEACFAHQGRARVVPFVRWVKRRIPPGSSFALLGADAACWQLNMLPRLLVARDRQPDWTVVVGPLPAWLRERSERESRLPRVRRSVFMFDSSLALVRSR